MSSNYRCVFVQLLLSCFRINEIYSGDINFMNSLNQFHRLMGNLFVTLDIYLPSMIFLTD